MGINKVQEQDQVDFLALALELDLTLEIRFVIVTV
jgi:hypothetical protein